MKFYFHVLIFDKIALQWMGWFGANMAGRRNKNAFKFVLRVVILSQTQILGVKNVFWVV